LGKPAEAVADEAVAAIREYHASDAAVELHLADQLLLPLALATGVSTFTAPRPSGHLMTNAWTIGQFGVADISIGQETPCRVRIEPRGWR
jgi:RNA 3'-terminal phosphate cyclase (ATP)